MKNVKAGETITFNIINLVKRNSLFNYGMQPVIFSQVANRLKGTKWFRGGFDISYTKNNILRVSSENIWLIFKGKAQENKNV